MLKLLLCEHTESEEIQDQSKMKAMIVEYQKHIAR